MNGSEEKPGIDALRCRTLERIARLQGNATSVYSGLQKKAFSFQKGFAERIRDSVESLSFSGGDEHLEKTATECLCALLEYGWLFPRSLSRYIALLPGTQELDCNALDEATTGLGFKCGVLGNVAYSLSIAIPCLYELGDVYAYDWSLPSEDLDWTGVSCELRRCERDLNKEKEPIASSSDTSRLAHILSQWLPLVSAGCRQVLTLVTAIPQRRSSAIGSLCVCAPFLLGIVAEARPLWQAYEDLISGASHSNTAEYDQRLSIIVSTMKTMGSR